jgi:hypothetical protein
MQQAHMSRPTPASRDCRCEKVFPSAAVRARRLKSSGSTKLCAAARLFDHVEHRPFSRHGALMLRAHL